MTRLGENVIILVIGVEVNIKYKALMKVSAAV